jgi:hypothetical protein
MRKDESNAARRLVGPIPFFDNDGKAVAGLTFKHAFDQVFTEGDGAADAEAAADVVEIGSGKYYYAFSQAETDFDAFISVTLSRPGTSGTSTSTAPNTLTDSGNTLFVDAFAGQTLIDSANARWKITSNTNHAFTIAASGATPAAGAYTVEAFKDIVWDEKIDHGVVSEVDDAAVQSIIDGTGSIVEGAATLGDMVRLLASVIAGLGQDFSTGTIVWKSLDGSKTRLTGTLDATGRIATVLGDLSP